MAQVQSVWNAQQAGSEQCVRNIALEMWYHMEGSKNIIMRSMVRPYHSKDKGDSRWCSLIDGTALIPPLHLLRVLCTSWRAASHT
jgi:hypothetical protein